jgi:HEAT repeat protein
MLIAGLATGQVQATDQTREAATPAKAAHATGQLQADTQAIDAALASSQAEQREWALDRIIATLDFRAELLPRIATLLDDTDLPVAGKAVEALSVRGAEAFPVIERLLKSGTTQQRWGATVALYQSSADIERFVPALTRQLADPDERVVRASLTADAVATKAASAPLLKPLTGAHGNSRFAGAARSVRRHAIGAGAVPRRQSD